MRYVGQEYFVNIPLAETFNASIYKALPEQFHAAYLARYGHSNPEEAIEFVNLRVSAIGQLARHSSSAQALSGRQPAHPPNRREVIFGREPWDTAVFNRVGLKPGDFFKGPAIVEEPSCTTVIPPAYQAEVDAYGNIVIVRSQDA
jgi:N-methylhydantoinase A